MRERERKGERERERERERGEVKDASRDRSGRITARLIIIIIRQNILPLGSYFKRHENSEEKIPWVMTRRNDRVVI